MYRYSFFHDVHGLHVMEKARKADSIHLSKYPVYERCREQASGKEEKMVHDASGIERPRTAGCGCAVYATCYLLCRHAILLVMFHLLHSLVHVGIDVCSFNDFLSLEVRLDVSRQHTCP